MIFFLVSSFVSHHNTFKKDHSIFVSTSMFQGVYELYYLIQEMIDINLNNYIIFYEIL